MMRNSWTTMAVMAGVLLVGCATDDSGGARLPLECEVTEDCPGVSPCVAGICSCALAADCGPGLECDDGACAAHGGGAEDDAAAGAACTADADCAAGLECDDGACAAHGGGAEDDAGAAAAAGGAEDDAGAAAAAGGAAGAACTLDADCAAGLECEHGACAAHGGRGV